MLRDPDNNMALLKSIQALKGGSIKIVRGQQKE